MNGKPKTCCSFPYGAGKPLWPAVLLALLVWLAGCSSHGRKRSGALLYWSSNNPYEIEFARRMVAEWNARHPEALVVHQPVPEGQSSEEVILAAVVGRTTPDIYSNMWQGEVEAYARAGALVPLDTIPGFLDSLYARCDSSVIGEVTATDGHIYQVPWKINPIMMAVNLRIFREAGVRQIPRTYSQYLAAARKIQRDRDGDGYVDRWIGYSEVKVEWWQRLFDFYPLYLAASGGMPLVQGRRVVFDNRPAREVFRFLRALYAGNYFPRERLSARQNPFLAGVIATRITGPWSIQEFERFKPPGFQYRFVPLPVPDDHRGPVYTYCDPKNIVLFSTCRRPEAAWRFVAFLISRRNDRVFLEMTNQLPRRKNLFQDPLFAPIFEQRPALQPFARQARYVRGTDASPVLKEVFDAISQQYEAAVVYRVSPVERAIKEAAQRVQLLIQ
ncbi:MAG: sugar ABC transporter substrate-binding protein [Calditrichaeota bacterium]|nr:MAG: sugar ABC transporter substrate-binding protein [Calditrichota bacterium]